MEFLKSAIENLHKIPLWLFLGLTCFGLITVYGPAVPGLNLAAAKTSLWIGPATLLCGVLSAAKMLSLCLSMLQATFFRAKAKSAVISVNERLNTAFWCSSQEPDGTPSVQINLNVKIHNTSNRYLEFTGASLTRPCLWSWKASSDTTLLIKNSATGLYSQNEVIYPQDTVECTLQAMIFGRSFRTKRRLNVTFRVQDNSGSTYKVRSRLFFVG